MIVRGEAATSNFNNNRDRAFPAGCEAYNGEAPWLVEPTVPRGDYVWATVAPVNASATTLSVIDVCGEIIPNGPVPVLFADVTVSTIGTLSAAALASEVVFGDVALSRTLALDVLMENLKFVSGRFELSNQPAAALPRNVGIGRLAVVGGAFRIAENQRGISLTAEFQGTPGGFDSLRYIGGALSVTGNTQLGSLTLPELREVGGALNVTANAVLATLDTPRLSSIGATIAEPAIVATINGNATQLTCPFIATALGGIDEDTSCNRLDLRSAASLTQCAKPATLCTVP